MEVRGAWVWMRGGSGSGSRGSLTREEPECTVRPTSPPLEGVVLRAQGRGLSEEGGRTERASQSRRRQSRRNVDAEREDDAMSLGKRHIGRRVAGVGVGVALMVLGLAAPAFAAVTITAFSPTSGPDRLRRGDHGNGLQTFPGPQMTLSTSCTGRRPTVMTAANFFVHSDTEIWVDGRRRLVDGDQLHAHGDNAATADLGIASTVTFLATTGAGGCAPTITSFTPTCGVVGDTVTITGTNLLGRRTSTALTCGSAPYGVTRTRIADHTVPDVAMSDDTQCDRARRVPRTARSRSTPTSRRAAPGRSARPASWCRRRTALRRRATSTPGPSRSRSRRAVRPVGSSARPRTPPSPTAWRPSPSRSRRRTG